MWISEAAPFRLRASSFPSSWHLSLGRSSCGVSLIKASTVWLMNRLCGISAPGWRSHSAAPRLLWGPPFHWALNQETALITLPPSSSSSSLSFLPSALSLSLLLIFPSFSSKLYLYAPPPFSFVLLILLLPILPFSLFLSAIMPHPWAKSGRGRRGDGIWELPR